MYMIVAGEGGHFAQAKRLLQGASEINSEKIVHVTDNYKSSLDCLEVVSIKSLRPKSSSIKISNLYNFILSLQKITKTLRKYKIVKVVSLGPGISVPVAIIAKCLGIKIIHVETWSRITTKSFTGRVMYSLSDEFIVQHRHMLKLYPKATYGGLL